jgi:DHA1 family multidrug resistance protein-like MFS transporter
VNDDRVHPHWKRTVTIVWICQFMAMSGAGLAYPFLPFYLKDFGITDEGSIAIWTGLLGTAAGVTLFIFSPIWGYLADRYGRKRMLLRSYFAGVVVMALQGYAPNVWWLLAMRLCQGMFMGSTSTATALVAANVPRPRLTSSLGLVATASFVSQISSPIAGGLLGVAVGFRATFVITAVLYAIAGLIAWRFLREGTPVEAARRKQAGGSPLVLLRDMGVFIPVLVLFVVYAAPSLSRPVIPLLLESFDASADSADAGLVFASLAVTSVVSSIVGGRVAARIGSGRMLTISLVGAGTLFLLVPLAGGMARLLVLEGAIGLFSGSLIPVANALLGERSPAGREGLVFGFAGSAQAAAIAVGPIAGGLIVAAAGTGAAFEATGAALLVTALVVVAFAGRNQPAAEPALTSLQPTVERNIAP